MPNVCYFTGKKTTFGKKRAYRGQKIVKGGFGLKTTGITRRTFKPNLQTVLAVVEENGKKREKRITVSARAIKTGLVVKPLKRKLETVDVWATGMRREQGVTRLHAELFELDMLNGGKLKINPLVSWSSEDGWDHIRAFDVPYNVLHDEGFPSIGCAPCTRAIEPGEDERAGRWWWERPAGRECGLHHDSTNARAEVSP